MVQSLQHSLSSKKFLTTRSVLIVTCLVSMLTILGVWLFGIGTYRTLFVNSILSTTILSYVFLTFLTTGLYNGIKLKDNLGKITDKIDLKKMPGLSDLDGLSDLSVDAGEGIFGILVAIFYWIVLSVFFFFLFTYSVLIFWL